MKFIKRNCYRGNMDGLTVAKYDDLNDTSHIEREVASRLRFIGDNVQKEHESKWKATTSVDLMINNPAGDILQYILKGMLLLHKYKDCFI